MENEGFFAFSAVQTTTVTLPSEQRCHYIRDDELDKLGEMHKEPVMEICLASIGVLFGSIVPTFDGLLRFNASTNPMTITDMVSAFLTFSALGISVVTGALWYQRSKSHRSLVLEIRDRPKVPVRLSQSA